MSETQQLCRSCE